MCHKIQNILSIETSCDDTSVAIVRADGKVIKLLSANQDKEHAPYGGIVPEVASRCHTSRLVPLIEEVLKQTGFSLMDIDAIAVTNRPGLIGALIVGVSTAKSLALSLDIPLIGVNHLEGHLMAPFLTDDEYKPPENWKFPCVALAVSGGHTSLYLVHDFSKYEIIGMTRDDAAGETFDKFAKMIGFEFPGGVKIDQLASGGNHQAFEFPRSMILDETLDMSFSGLKSAGHRFVEKKGLEFINLNIHNVCASFQEAIVDVLVEKLKSACKKYNLRYAIVTGGVSANSRLRSKIHEWSEHQQIQLAYPPPRYCTDNAAMIGLVGIKRLNSGERSDWNLGPHPEYLVTDFYSPQDASLV